MSDPVRDMQAAASAGDIDARAAEWVAERNYADEWSESDQARLDAWLDQSPAHKVAYWRLDAAWRRTEWLSAFPAPRQEAAGRRPLPAMVKLAAGFAALAIVSGAFAARYFASPHERSYSTPVGGHEVISFSDGTRIELNTNTVIRTLMTSDQRQVWLDKGEAFFQVKHDSAHPFIVTAGNHRITDLGTQFVVRRAAAKIQVAVEQGRVWLDARKPSQSTLLMPGDVAMASANAVSVTHRSKRELDSELGWRRGVLVFQQTTLAEAAVQFNRYNQRKLVVSGDDVSRMKIDGTFHATNVDAFARLARGVLGLTVAESGNEIVISR